MITKSEKRVCICEEKDKKVAYVDTVKLKGHELETLDLFYCITCNSSWLEA